MIGWTSVLFAVQSWLSETPAQKAKAATPAYFSVGMAIMAVGVVSLLLITTTCSGRVVGSITECVSVLVVHASFPAAATCQDGAGEWDGGACCGADVGRTWACEMALEVWDFAYVRAT